MRPELKCKIQLAIFDMRHIDPSKIKGISGKENSFMHTGIF